MKILVTGASAFIGSSLNELLADKFEIHAPPSSELNLLNSEDVRNYLKKNSFDFIIHSANHLVHPLLKESKNPDIQLTNNLKMFFNIAENKDYFGKMIYFGSGAEFGRENWKSKMKEDFFGNSFPNDQYGLSKYFMNIHCRLSSNIFNLRLFGMFGIKDDWRFRLIPNLCAQALTSKEIIVNQNAVFSFLYIEDLAGIVENFILNTPLSGDYNICPDNEYELIDIAKIINSLDKEKKIVVKKKGISTKYSGDNGKLKQAMPNLSFTPINKGIEAVYTFYKKNPEIIDPSKFLIK